MSEYGPGIDWTLVAVPDMSAHQYRVAMIASGGVSTQKTLTASQAGDAGIGIIQNKPQSGEAVRVRFVGISKAIAGAAVVAGDVLRANATGFLVTGNSGYCIGWALNGVGSGGLFTMFVQPHQSIA